jgi:uncharacterized protein (DUF58 family)
MPLRRLFQLVRRPRVEPAPDATAGHAPALDADELREIRRLHLEAGRAVDALFAGEWRSTVRGRGMEFEEVRSYNPGDDVRHIDWNVTARSGEPFVKVFREERQNTVLLAVDVSGSTRVGTGGRDGRTDRRRQMARIAGGLAFACFRNRDRTGLLTFSDRIETWLPPRRSGAHTWAVIRAVFAAHAQGRGTDIGAALQHLAATQKRRATIVVVSDFLDPAAWEQPLGALARRHTVHAICVTDPLDDPAAAGLARLGLVEIHDSETGKTAVVDARALHGRTPVQARLDRVKRTGARAFTVSTADDAFEVLRREYAGRKGRR